MRTSTVRLACAEGLALVLIGGACGGQANAPRPSASPTAASPSPTPIPTDLLVVVSPKSVTAPVEMTLTMIDIGGHAIATTDFAPPPAPRFSNCGDVLQPAVRVAAGAAFFADKTGVVRRLDPDGKISEVATFHLANSQQYLSYAVSPDGTQLIGIIVTTPPLINPTPPIPADIFVAGGRWTLDLQVARAGGATTVALHRDLGTSFPKPTIITGWDDRGPTATLNSVICTQAALPSLQYTGSQLIHLALDGAHRDVIGGAGCVPLDGTVLCGQANYLNGPYALTVRRSNGSILWSRQTTGVAILGPKLAPDGNSVAWGAVYRKGSSQAASLPGQNPLSVALLGWAGSGAVVIARADGQLGLASVTAPLVFNDLGLTVNGQSIGYLPFTPYLAGTIGFA